MDAAIYTLMLFLAASGLDGTQVLVSIPEGTYHSTYINNGGRKHWHEIVIIAQCLE